MDTDMDEDSHIRSALTSEVWAYQPQSAESIRHSAWPIGARTTLRWSAAGLVAAVVLGAGWWGIHVLGGRQGPSYASDREVTVLTHQTMPIGRQARLAGVLVLEGGCLKVDGTPVIWPAGSQWDAANQSVTTSQGGKRYTIATGGPLPGLGGGAMPLDAVSKYLDASSLAAVASCLDSPRSEVLVVN